MSHERFIETTQDEFYHQGQRNFMVDSTTAGFITVGAGAIIIALTTQILEGRRLSRRDKDAKEEARIQTKTDKFKKV